MNVCVLGVWVSLTPLGNTLLLCFLNAHSNQPSLTPLLQQTGRPYTLTHCLCCLIWGITVPYVKFLMETDWRYFRWKPIQKHLCCFESIHTTTRNVSHKFAIPLERLCYGCQLKLKDKTHDYWTLNMLIIFIYACMNAIEIVYLHYRSINSTCYLICGNHEKCSKKSQISADIALATTFYIYHNISVDHYLQH